MSEPEGVGPAGVEGPAGHEADPPIVDPKVPTRIFLFVGLFLLALGILYGATAYEESGTVMLLGGGALGLWIGAYLWLQLRAGTDDDEAAGPDTATARVPSAAAEGVVAEHEGLYLPHASA